MRPLPVRMAAALVALLGSVMVAGCGGGGATADTTPQVRISSVKVFGDSLQDSGTFGFKFTVQTANNALYVERIAAAYGQTLCNFFRYTGVASAPFAANPTTGCTNFAIGGGEINYTGAGANSALVPLTIGTQMATYAAAGSYAASDLVIIDGGGNDAASLVGAYLRIQPGNAASVASYATLLGTLLTPAQVNTALGGGAAGLAAVGNDYMKALADKFYDSIKTSVLDKGATHVVVLNIPDITFTPRFQRVLDAVALASGGGATVRAQMQALFQGWVSAFNAQLAGRVGGDERVALVDFYKAFQDQVATPAQFGLTNVTTPACPSIGVDAQQQPTYNLAVCTEAALAAPPSGASGADWWKSYAFADNFHPTPYGHQLTQQLIAKSLATKGWL